MKYSKREKINGLGIFDYFGIPYNPITWRNGRRSKESEERMKHSIEAQHFIFKSTIVASQDEMRREGNVQELKRLTESYVTTMYPDFLIVKDTFRCLWSSLKTEHHISSVDVEIYLVKKSELEFNLEYSVLGDK